MAVDWTFKISDLISLVGFVGGGLIFILMLRNQVNTLGLRFDYLSEQFTKETERQNQKIDKQAEEIRKLGEVLIIIGRFEERMAAVQKDVDDLRHGRGFINNNVRPTERSTP